MKITEVGVTYRRTWQTQSYESLTEEVTFRAELEEGEDHLLSCKTLQKQAHSLVNQHAGPLLEACGRLKTKATEKVAGLEIE